MATYAESIICPSLRGSVGGVTFRRGSQSAVLEAKPRGPLSRTQSQLLSRARFQSLCSTWRTLTDAQRLAWRTAAANAPRLNRLGGVFFPTGFQAFLFTNAGRVMGVDDWLLEPPAYFQPVPLLDQFSLSLAAPLAIDIVCPDTGVFSSCSINFRFGRSMSTYSQSRVALWSPLITRTQAVPGSCYNANIWAVNWVGIPSALEWVSFQVYYSHPDWLPCLTQTMSIQCGSL